MLRDCAPVARCGLCLASKTTTAFRLATLREIIEAVGSDRIGVCLDTANSFGAGEGIGNRCCGARAAYRQFAH